MHKIDNNITGGSQHVRDHEFIDTSRFTGILQGGAKKQVEPGSGCIELLTATRKGTGGLRCSPLRFASFPPVICRSSDIESMWWCWCRAGISNPCSERQSWKDVLVISLSVCETGEWSGSTSICLRMEELGFHQFNHSTACNVFHAFHTSLVITDF